MLDIEHQQGEWSLRASGTLELEGEGLLESSMVVQTGEPIGTGQLFELFYDRFQLQVGLLKLLGAFGYQFFESLGLPLHPVGPGCA